jgi:hypothetical protein
MPTTKAITKAASSGTITERSANSFLMFKEPDFVTGVQPLGTLQPLINGSDGGFFVKMETVNACRWLAQKEDFHPDDVIWNHNHRFNNGARELGHFFTRPRLQIIHISDILICEEGQDTKQRIVGDFSKDEYGNYRYPDAVSVFESDKQEFIEGRRKSRRFNTRTKYLVRLLTKENRPAHEAPIVLTTKGLVSVEMSKHISEFRKEMEKCLSTYLDMMAMTFENKFHVTCVFCPTLIVDNRGEQNVPVVCVEEFVGPSCSTKEEAFASLAALTIPDEDREKVWEIMTNPYFADYINIHSKQDGIKLNGAYGLADGVSLKPAGVIDAPALPAVSNDTGEDSSLM